MKVMMRVLAVLALLASAGACTQLGIAPPSGVSSVDPPIYEPSPSN